MFNIGPGEMMLLGMLALLLFGPKRLPELGKALGEGIAAFRHSTKGVADEFRRQLEEETAAKPDVPSEHVAVTSPLAGAQPMGSHPPEAQQDESEEHIPVS